MRNPFRALFNTKSIASSYDLLNYLLAGTQSLAGPTINENTAFNIPAVWTAISIRARALASLPIRVYERLPDGRSKRPAVNHPLTRVLTKPNGWQTRADLFAMLEAHRVLRGNAYCWINRVSAISADGQMRDQVQELVPLHPDRMEVDQLDDLGGPLTYKLHRRNGQVLPLPPREVLHLRNLSTNGITGRSVLQDARDMLGMALATQEHASTFWQKGGLPSIALRHPKQLSEKAKKNLEESWEATYGGSKDKRRVAVIEEGMEIEQLSLTANDSQFLETRKFSRSEIFGWFHIPPHMAGDTEKATSWGTGIEQQQIGFLTFTLRPDLVAWEQRISLDLIQIPDKYYAEFNVDGVMRGDATARANYYWRMVQMGAMSPNDVRALENWNPIEGGDVYLQPSNMVPLGSDPSATFASQAASMHDTLEQFGDRLVEVVRLRPAPPITVNSPVTIADGAIRNQAGAVNVAAPINVPAPIVNAPVTIAAGAIRADLHVTDAPASVPVPAPRVVHKSVERNADGQITGVTEEIA